MKIRIGGTIVLAAFVLFAGHAHAGQADAVNSFFGEFQESIPLATPSFHGIEPQLSLTYGSSGGNDFVGVGWTLQGAGLIERAQPGRGAPKYNSTDIYYMGGVELVKCGGAVTSPGCSAGGNYTTKLESYAKIKFDSAANTWTLWKKNGTKTVYSALFAASGGTFRWAPTSESDPSGNSVTYAWYCDPAKECYLNRISYGPVTIDFYREARTDSVFFATGTSVGEMRYRLRSVVVRVAGSLLRAYRLSYTTSAATNRSLLASVTEHGRNATVDGAGAVSGGTTLPAMTFSYESTGLSIPSHSATPPIYSAITVNNGSYNDNGVRYADINGDGRDDILWGLWECDGSYGTGCQAHTSTWLSTGSGWTAGPALPTYFAISINGVYQDNGLRIADLNGDGKQDLLWGLWECDSSYGNGCQAHRSAWLSTGTGFTPAPALAPPTYFAITGAGGNYQDNGLRIADLNADGKADLLWGLWECDGNYGTGCEAHQNAWLSTGTGFTSAPALAPPTYFAITGAGGAYHDNGLRIADLNGDGKSDLLWGLWECDGNYGTGCQAHQSAWLSTGTAFASAPALAPPTYFAITGAGGAYHDNGLRIADVNGDGKSDLLWGLWECDGNYGTGCQAHQSGWVSTGSGWAGGPAPPTYFAITGAGGAYQDNGLRIIDLNGDGRDDLMWSLWECDGNYGTGCQAHKGTWLSKGNSFASSSALAPAYFAITVASGNYQDNGVRFPDVDGDGRPDFQWGLWECDGNYGTGCQAHLQAWRSSVGRDLLTTFTTGFGSSSTVTYVPSSTWANTNGPPVLQTVSKVVSNDGRGVASTTNYSYSGGLFDRIERRFLGFRYVKEIEPCPYGTSSCPYTETWFKQDYGSASKPERVDKRDGSGKILASTTYVYSSNGATVPHTSLETQQWMYLYDGSGASCSAWPCAQGKRSVVTRAYDTYANVTSEVAYGDYDVSGDEVGTYTTYYPNSSAYIVELPGQVIVRKGTSSTGTQLTKSLLYYDQTASNTTAPTKGLVRRESQWLSTTGAYVSTEKTYDAWGNVLTAKDPLGNVTTSTYDATYHLYPATKKDVFARTFSTSWDLVCGKPLSVTQPDGRATTYTYDPLCRETKVTSPGGGYTKYVYSGLGNASAQYTETAIPGPNGTDVWKREYFDGLGRVWRTALRGPSSSQDIRVDTDYDGRGTPRRSSLPYYANASAKWVSVTRDANDRPTKITNPDGTYQTISYGLGVTTTTDELGRWRKETRNGRGQLVQVSEKIGTGTALTNYTWDDLGHPKTIKDDANNTWTFTYDSLGRRTQSVDPDAGTTNYTFDAAGRETARVDARGKRTEHTYDAASRVLTRKYGVGAADAITSSFVYDQARSGYYNQGQLTTVTDPAGTQTIDYDIAGNVVRSTRTISGASYTFTKGYDVAGRLKWTTFPDGDTVGTAASPLTYDDAGRLKTVPGYVTASAYDAAGHVTSQTNANGTVTTRTYDANRAWLSSIGTVKSTTTIQNLVYTRSAVGQITKVTSAKANEGWNYTYDDLGRLTAATNLSSSAHNQTFSYNDVGNITSNSRLGTYSYAAAGSARPHAVTAAGGNAYSYDAAGNLASGAGRTIVWDAANRPASVNGATFVYSATGERIKKVEGGVTSIFVGEDYEVRAGVVTKYIRFGGELVAKKVGSAKYWLHSDHLGSVQAVTDSAGAEILRVIHRPFGERLSTSSSHLQSRAFAGQVHDDSGLFYLHARYYDPALGRFISPDPSLPSASGQGLNRYSFAGNDPVNVGDADGLGLFKSIKKAFKKVGNALKSVGKTLQKWAASVAKIPVLGGIAALVMNTVGAALQGDWANALRGVATIAIIVGTIWLGGVIGGALAGNTMGMFAARVVSQAALGATSGYAIARVNGATHKEALRAALTGAKMGMAMEAFSSFMEVAFPDVAKSGTGMKPDLASTPKGVQDRFVFMRELGDVMGDENMFYEGGVFDRFMGSGAMRGQSKLFTWIHDNVMEMATAQIGKGNWYIGKFFNPMAGTAFQRFIVEIPLNFGTMWAIEQGFKLAGEKIESRLNSAGLGTLGYLANGTLNPFMGIGDAVEYGTTMRIRRELGL